MHDDDGDIGNWQSDDGDGSEAQAQPGGAGGPTLRGDGFKDETETAEPSPTRSIHEARRLRQAGQALDGALAVFAGMDMAKATTREARWAYTEWKQLVKRRFGDRDVTVYRQGAGRAAALVPRGDGTLEVAVVLGMRWRPGKLVSERSLRGLRPLERACP